MQAIELPASLAGLRISRLLDWSPAPIIKPNHELLRKLNARRSRQSEISRQRQQFITGVSVYRMTKEELESKLAYIEEWHLRMQENEW